MLLLLADQMYAALHRIDLLARLQEEEKQRYFRSLVLTSSDVTLISRDDRVAYATPSAGPMFGRDVKGRRFGELVNRNPATTQRQTEWADVEDGADGEVLRPDGRRVDVLVRRRDLTADPSVVGVVSTLRDVTSERDLQRDLAYRASHDALTGLANAQLLHRGAAEANRPDRATTPMSGGPCCSSTSTTSRRSTTATVTRSETPCCASWRSGSRPACGPTTLPRAWAATSSRSCCAAYRVPTTRAGWPSGSRRRCPVPRLCGV